MIINHVFYREHHGHMALRLIGQFHNSHVPKSVPNFFCSVKLFGTRFYCHPLLAVNFQRSDTNLILIGCRTRSLSFTLLSSITLQDDIELEEDVTPTSHVTYTRDVRDRGVHTV